MESGIIYECILFTVLFGEVVVNTKSKLEIRSNGIILEKLLKPYQITSFDD
ncbi:Uncharacterised protein [Sphingobacterium spiritivorum]|uniref:Uncharacterized protein n=1 Tax=Sphingobacterium spiritivorum ATCC 33861 TaxID=525373 RepID=D7VS24_SPHSI|nr:hypothetical protein HMPREF0766_13778 [Sphingobacterium spiritivorum ATCC 33861]SUJ05446.1 Uncharacterised protein [Sphingobacterium spiritivorum]